MIGEEKPRDLAALMSPRAGWLEHAEDPWEPYRLCDRAGTVVGPVAVYLRDLQASARPETTLRAYSTALLRWFRPINCTMSLISSQADCLVSQGAWRGRGRTTCPDGGAVHGARGWLCRCGGGSVSPVCCGCRRRP